MDKTECCAQVRHEQCNYTGTERKCSVRTKHVDVVVCLSRLFHIRCQRTCLSFLIYATASYETLLELTAGLHICLSGGGGGNTSKAFAPLCQSYSNWVTTTVFCWRADTEDY